VIINTHSLIPLLYITWSGVQPGSEAVQKELALIEELNEAMGDMESEEASENDHTEA